MKYIDLNNEGGIGANSTYLELGPFKLIVDAGLHPKLVGNKATPAFELVEDFSLDLILLTHAHLDHIGSLPLLSRRQTQAPILCSIPTQMLAARMLRNSYGVMKRQREEQSIPEYPLYGMGEIESTERQLQPIQFHKPRSFYKGNEELIVTFYPAGHVAGAAGIMLEYKKRKIFITGDVLFADQLTLPGARFPDFKVDTLITETTRGTNERKKQYDREKEYEELIEAINLTIHRGGCCLIPTFALGRMQELLARLHRAHSSKTLTDCPIYSMGLGIDLCDYFDNISRKTSLIHFRRSILKELKVKSPNWDSLAPGNTPEEPAIYLMSSGMLVEHTPSYNIAAALLSNKANSICFVGYCDPDAPGGKLLACKHEDSFSFDVLHYISPVNAQILRFDLSGHAYRDELLNLAVNLEPRAIVLTHGDPPAREWFTDELALELPKTKVLNPTPRETYNI